MSGANRYAMKAQKAKDLITQLEQSEEALKKL